MKRTVKHNRQSQQRAMSVVRNDLSPYQVAFQPTGEFGGYGAQLANPGFLFQQPFLTNAYTYNGLITRCVDIYAGEMTRKGFCVKDIDEEDEAILLSRAEELNVNHHLNNAMKWRNAYGGSIIVMGVNDGGILTTPLKEEGEIHLEFLRVYDRFEVTRGERYKDPSKSNYGQVMMWKINSSDGMPGYEVHESRVLVIDGDSVPNHLRMGNLGWGVSLTQKIYDAVCEFDSTHKFAKLLLERMQQAIHQIPNLGAMLSEPDGVANMQKRVAVVDAVRNAYNAIMLDANETYDIKNSSLSGVHEILDRKAEKVCAVSGIPMFVLFGRSIGGLNANGDTNQDAWEAQIAAMQNDVLRNPVDRIVSLLLREQSGGSYDGGDYKIEFNPLSNPSDEKQAEIDYKKAQTKKASADAAKVYIDINALDPIEVRRTLQEEYEIPEADLNKEIDNAPPEPELLNVPQVQSSKS